MLREIDIMSTIVFVGTYVEVSVSVLSVSGFGFY